MIDRARVVDLIGERGARTIPHPGGTLLEHLSRVADLLTAWGAADDVVIAGLAHAVYGTDGFDVALFRLDERRIVAEATGEAPEAIVYRYASCDRSDTLRQLGRSGGVVMRNRFTGDTEELAHQALRDFAELTFANEIDLARHSDDFRREYGPAIASLFAGWRALVSERAFAEFLRTFGDAVPDAASP